jgi:hypothetical protein
MPLPNKKEKHDIWGRAYTLLPLKVVAKTAKGQKAERLVRYTICITT